MGYCERDYASRYLIILSGDNEEMRVFASYDMNEEEYLNEH